MMNQRIQINHKVYEITKKDVQKGCYLLVKQNFVGNLSNDDALEFTTILRQEANKMEYIRKVVKR